MQIQRLGLSLDAEIELDPKRICLPCPSSANEAWKAQRNPAAPNFQGDISVRRKALQSYLRQLTQKERRRDNHARLPT
ncbi:hypothetical protein Q8A67_024496 [Cirrhinus molitorella]|uniref:Uncharacterized protein n=1 Tax=Cirrhinus molitorella TaxID=172907 RepID=A0AA88P5I6_9TELE|nr:hypothetical protein Q8A67_024496 [Cirrhinus molitorella]